MFSDEDLLSGMDSLFVQFSGLAGVLVFLHQLWAYAPIERTIYVSAGTAIGVYLVLVVGHAAVHHILEYRPPQLAEDTAGAKDSSSRPSSEPAESKPEPSSA